MKPLVEERLELESRFEVAINGLTDQQLSGTPDAIASLIISGAGGQKEIRQAYDSSDNLEEDSIELLELLEARFERCSPSFFLPYLDIEPDAGLDNSFTPRQIVIATLSLKIFNAFRRRLWPAEAKDARSPGGVVSLISARARRASGSKR